MKRRAATTDLPIALDRSGGVRAGLYAALRDAMIDGRLRAGARLPSTRDLARQLGVSRGAVVDAFAQLASEGYLAARVGAGTTVAATLPDAAFVADGPAGGGVAPIRPRVSRWANALGRGPFAGPSRPLRPFHAHVPALDAFPIDLWNRLLVQRARRTTVSMLADSDPRGFRPLREALAGHLRLARGVHVEVDQLFIVQSVQQALHLAARVLTEPGERVAVEDPHYVGAIAAVRAAGSRVAPVPVDDDGMDVASLARAHARMAYVTPAHQAPLGVTMTLPRRLALLAWAEAHRAWIFEDDYDSEFRHEGRPVPTLQAHDRAGGVIHAGSFSKTLFPGLRLGYLVAPAPLVEAFMAARSVADRYSPVLAQAVVADFIADGHFARHLRRMRQLYGARRAALLDALAREVGGRLTVVGAPAGLELVARLPDADDDVAIVDALAVRGVDAQALSTLSLRRRPPRGLVLGFAAVSERRLRAAATVLGEVLAAAAK